MNLEDTKDIYLEFLKFNINDIFFLSQCIYGSCYRKYKKSFYIY